MDAIKVDCPACGARLKAERERAGEQAVCPGCGERVRVPGEPVLEKDQAEVERLPVADGGRERAGAERAGGLNRRQVAALCVGACILAAVLLCPPWRVYQTESVRVAYGKYELQSHLVAGAHSFIWKPTTRESLIDAYRLIAECVAVAVLTGAAVLALRWRWGIGAALVAVGRYCWYSAESRVK